MQNIDFNIITTAIMLWSFVAVAGATYLLFWSKSTESEEKPYWWGIFTLFASTGVGIASLKIMGNGNVDMITCFGIFCISAIPAWLTILLASSFYENIKNKDTQ